jgi:hypothetical protein
MNPYNPFPGQAVMCNLLSHNYSAIQDIPYIRAKGPILCDSLGTVREYYLCDPAIPCCHKNPIQYADSLADFFVDNLFSSCYKEITQRPSGHTLNLTHDQLMKMNPNRDLSFFQNLMHVMLYLQYKDTLWRPKATGGAAKTSKAAAAKGGGGAVTTPKDAGGDGGAASEDEGGDGGAAREDVGEAVPLKRARKIASQANAEAPIPPVSAPADTRDGAEEKGDSADGEASDSEEEEEAPGEEGVDKSIWLNLDMQLENETLKSAIYTSKADQDNVVKILTNLFGRPSRAELDAVENELASAKTERIPLVDHQALQAELDAVKKELESAKTERDSRIPQADHHALQAELADIKKVLLTAVPLAEHNKLEKELTEARRDLAAAKEELRAVVEEKKDFIPPYKHVSLQRELTAEKEKVAHYEKEVEAYIKRPTQANLDQLTFQLEAKDQEVRNLAKEAQDLRKKHREQSLLLEQQTQLVQQLTASGSGAAGGGADQNTRAMLKNAHDQRMGVVRQLNDAVETIEELNKKIEEMGAAKASVDQELVQLKAAKAKVDQELQDSKAAKALVDQALTEATDALKAAGNPQAPPPPPGAQSDALDLRERNLRIREDEMDKQERYTEFLEVVKATLGNELFQRNVRSDGTHKEIAVSAVRALAALSHKCRNIAEKLKVQLKDDYVPKQVFVRMISSNRLMHDSVITANLQAIVQAVQCDMLTDKHFDSLSLPLTVSVFDTESRMYLWTRDTSQILPLFKDDNLWECNIVTAILMVIGSIYVEGDMGSVHDLLQYLETNATEKSFEEFMHDIETQITFHPKTVTGNLKSVAFPIPQFFFQTAEKLKLKISGMELYFLCLMPNLIKFLLSGADDFEAGLAAEKNIFGRINFHYDYPSMFYRLRVLATRLKPVWDRLGGKYAQKTSQMAYLIKCFIGKYQAAGAGGAAPAITPAQAGGAAGAGGAAPDITPARASGAAGAGGAAPAITPARAGGAAPAITPARAGGAAPAITPARAGGAAGKAAGDGGHGA